LDIRLPQLADETKCAILNTIWGSNYTTERLHQNGTLGNNYIRYYDEQCRNALHSKGLHKFIKTHADVTDIIQELKDVSRIVHAFLGSSKMKFRRLIVLISDDVF
jgi:phage terminase large subunit-like protein